VPHPLSLLEPLPPPAHTPVAFALGFGFGEIGPAPTAASPPTAGTTSYYHNRRGNERDHIPNPQVQVITANALRQLAVLTANSR
jgi:hypothetical protein